MDVAGTVIGDVAVADAILAAEREGLDLVEISPNASPPVCKVMNYGKFRYKEQKKRLKTKTTAKKMKELKLGINISNHDFDFKMKHAEDFLADGHSARFIVSLKGREMQHAELARALIQRITNKLDGIGLLQDEVVSLGNKSIATFVPDSAKLKQQK